MAKPTVAGLNTQVLELRALVEAQRGAIAALTERLDKAAQVVGQLRKQVAETSTRQPARGSRRLARAIAELPEEIANLHYATHDEACAAARKVAPTVHRWVDVVPTDNGFALR